MFHLLQENGNGRRFDWSHAKARGNLQTTHLQNMSQSVLEKPQNGGAYVIFWINIQRIRKFNEIQIFRKTHTNAKETYVPKVIKKAVSDFEHICEECGKSFQTKDYLKKHLAR